MGRIKEIFAKMKTIDTTMRKVERDKHEWGMSTFCYKRKS